jgi:hypothetical protein
MWSFLVAALVLAADPEPAEAPPADVPLGWVRFEANVPAEVRINRRPIAQVFVPSSVEVAAPIGQHELTVLVGGTPSTFPLVVPPPPDRAVVMVGRSGTSVRSEARPVAAADHQVPLELRGTGPGPVQVRIAAVKYRVEAGATVGLTLAPGEYPVSVRSPDGTAIWATGRLTVSGGDVVIVQLTEGRLPEVTGAGSFVANGG